MKTIAPPPVASPLVQALESFWLYADRLAGAWDHPGDRDLDVLDARLARVEDIVRAEREEDGLPPATLQQVVAARAALHRARGMRAEARIRHVETAGSLILRLRAEVAVRE
jgi:hypothetical protein